MRKIKDIKSIKVKQLKNNEWAVFMNGEQVTKGYVKSVADSIKETFNRDIRNSGFLVLR